MRSPGTGLGVYADDLMRLRVGTGFLLLTPIFQHRLPIDHATRVRDGVTTVGGETRLRVRTDEEQAGLATRFSLSAWPVASTAGMTAGVPQFTQWRGLNCGTSRGG